MLKVGINWLSPHTLPVVQRLLDEGVADFCEIMVDNAVHLPPQKILSALSGAPIALHIVHSHFLAKPMVELEDIAKHLRPWIEALQPFYVSDHLPPLDCANNFEKTAERVDGWQTLLGAQLLIENASSMQIETASQAKCYARLIEQTQCSLLFDFSNAYIAEYNCHRSHPAGLPARDPGPLLRSNWASLLKQTRHFHIAGFRIDPDTNLAYDTHDVAIADDVFAIMQYHFAQSAVPESIVFELDARLDYELARQEILRIKNGGYGALKKIPMRQSRPRVLASGAGVSFEDKKQELIAFVTEWSLRGMEHINAKGVIARCKAFPGLAVGLWKGDEPAQPAKIVTLDISRLSLPPADAYGVSYQLGSWRGVEWFDHTMLQSAHL